MPQDNGQLKNLVHELRTRVAELERQVAELKQQGTGPGPGDWRRTIGMFGDDPGMRRLFDDALKIRERDREKARRSNKKRRSRVKA